MNGSAVGILRTRRQTRRWRRSVVAVTAVSIAATAAAMSGTGAATAAAPQAAGVRAAALSSTAGSSTAGSSTAGSSTAGSAAAPTQARPYSQPYTQRRLERMVLSAVRSAGFTNVVDGDQSFPYPRIAATPNVDVAVIQLDAAGRPQAAANVLLSRDYPRGTLAPIGRDLRSDGVRFRSWNLDRFDGANGFTWTSPPFTAADDVVAGREDAPIEFMEPYPASTFKLVVGYWVAHLVDTGVLDWDDSYAYDPGPNPPSLCSQGARTATIAQFLDTMLSASNNRDTCALLKRLHELDQVDAMNVGLIELGLPSLKVLGTDPATGGSWQVGKITVGAFDAAKLLLLIDGGPGTLFRRADGGRVTRSDLSERSRAVLRQALADQGFNEVLSTTNWCRHRLPAEFDLTRPYPTRGIPAATPQRWLDDDGRATVDGIPYPADTRPCNAAAEVTFAHKTGLTRNYGSDLGVVHSLPGAPRRDYIITIISNLGNRYTDRVMNQADADPQQGDCWTADFICYSESFARFGRAVDTGVTRITARN
ncbi:MAG: serine hydrolase [Angustibacter sp.]